MCIQSFSFCSFSFRVLSLFKEGDKFTDLYLVDQGAYKHHYMGTEKNTTEVGVWNKYYDLYLHDLKGDVVQR